MNVIRPLFFTFAVILAPLGAPIACAQSLLGNSFNGVLYDVDVATGAASNPRSTGTGVDSLTGITFGPDGTLYGLTTFAGVPSNALVAINPATGASTTIGSTGLAIAEGDLAFDPTSGALYGVQHVPSNRQLFTLDVSTGVGTVVGDLGGLEDAELSAMTFALDGTLYILDTGVNLGTGEKLPTRLLTVDKSTAAILSAVTLPVNLGFTAGMDFHPATDTLYVADGGLGDGTNSLYTLDPTTGAVTLVGPTGLPGGLAGLAFAIPEPTTQLLAGLSLLPGIAFRRRRLCPLSCPRLVLHARAGRTWVALRPHPPRGSRAIPTSPWTPSSLPSCVPRISSRQSTSLFSSGRRSPLSSLPASFW